LKIESYDLRMDSARSYRLDTTRKLQVGYRGGMNSLPQKNFGETLSNIADNETPKTGESFATTATKASHSPTPELRDIQSIRQQFVLYLWRMLFGDESARKMSEKYGITTHSSESSSTLQSPATITLYGIRETHTVEEQYVSFASSGNVTTADGRSIDFNVAFEMSSRFEQYYREESMDVINLCDPLVLNISGDMIGLSDQKFLFDLDADGQKEMISSPLKGNAFLALDKNKDGLINDGSELFGTKSGDGFSDLSAYDTDRNGWIDENDAVFDLLKVWYRDESGEDKLLSLKESGVGAIYLGSADTNYVLRNSLNNTEADNASDNANEVSDSSDVNGVLRRTGIFLYENAMAGFIAHLDMNTA